MNSCLTVGFIKHYIYRFQPIMKLLVHNFLSSKFLKGVQTGFPLKLVTTQIETKEVDFNPDFVKRMVPKLDWTALQVISAGFAIILGFWRFSLLVYILKP